MYFSFFTLFLFSHCGVSTDYLIFTNQENKTFRPPEAESVLNQREFTPRIQSISTRFFNSGQTTNIEHEEERKNIFSNSKKAKKNNWLSEISLSDTSRHFSSLEISTTSPDRSPSRNCVLMLLGNLFVCWFDKPENTNGEVKVKKKNSLPESARLMPLRK